MTARDIEIMAPVGSYESLMAAIQGNADSVYFGIGHLNMRSKSSKNFTLEDLEEISSIAQKNKLRTYITLNAVIYDDELDEMKKIVDAAIRNQISAIIASDQAVIQYANKVGMEIHMSTQTNITNLEAVKYWSKYADVMVTARELNLKQVAGITREIEKQEIKGPSGHIVQIEVFAHGALCMAVSGKCYLSLDNLNSSANRGACLQQCRRPYKVTDDDGIELRIDNEYIMSPRDLKTLDFLDKILKAGVRVLKIEGRGRSADYVKTVSKVYRDAVDAYFEDRFNDENKKQWNKELATVYNRDFWDGYYLGKKLGEWTEQYGSRATKRKIYIGKINNYFSKLKVAEIKMETQNLSVRDEIKIIGPTTGVYDGMIIEIRVGLNNVGQTVKGDFCSIPVDALVRRGDKVYKIVDVVEEDELAI
jgi:putative protease